jgi:hypothetical protein
MAIGTLSAQLSSGLTVNAQNAGASTVYSGVTASVTINQQFKNSTASNNNVAGGSDQSCSFIQIIAASGNATLDLTNMTNILGTAASGFARLKMYMAELLSAAQDSVNGTTCTSVTLGNAGSNINTLEFGTANTTFTYNINNGGCHGPIWDTTAAGFVLVDGTHKNVKIVNNDATNAAAIQISFVGGST